jgi:hypothetical protein
VINKLATAAAIAALVFVAVYSVMTLFNRFGHVNP